MTEFGQSGRAPVLRRRNAQPRHRFHLRAAVAVCLAVALVGVAPVPASAQVFGSQCTDANFDANDIRDFTLRLAVRGALGLETDGSISYTQIKELKHLNIWDHGQTSLVPVFENGVQIRIDNFVHPDFTSGDYELRDKISTIAGLECADNLEVLVLTDSSLSGVINISRWANLRVLYLGANYITGVTGFKDKLEHLHLYGNEMGDDIDHDNDGTTDPVAPTNGINASWRLEVLHLGWNDLQNIVDSGVPNLPNLTWLSLQSNIMSSGLNVSNSPHLRYLNVSHTEITSRRDITGERGHTTIIFGGGL